MGAEVSDKRIASVYEHPALLEFQARTNAQTIADQQKHHAEEISRLHADYRSKLKAKNEEIELRDRAIAYIAKERNHFRSGYTDLQELLENAVIDPATLEAKPTTLWFLIEAELFRRRCADCKDVTCPGECGAEVTA